MKLYQLEKKQVLPISIREAWAFFSDPRNLQRITPPSLGLEISSEVPESMYPGLILNLRVHFLAGIRINWITEITHVNEPYFFVDEQRYGPYRFWHHKHYFRETRSGTEIGDLVHYSLHLGPLGRMVNALFVRKQLEGIFDYRYKYLLEKFTIP